MALSTLIINPFVHDFKLYDEWMHPLGLYLLMDALHTNGYDVRYFDCLERTGSGSNKKYATGTFRCREIPKPALFHAIKRKYKQYGCTPEQLRDFLDTAPHPDIIFVGSMMTYWAEGVVATVEIIREVLPEVPVVVGGLGVRLFPEFFRRKLPDAAVYDGILPEGSTILLPGADRPLRISAAPSLLTGFSLSGAHRHGPILLSSGCPMNCTYCASRILQPRYRRRPLETVLREVEASVEQYGCRDMAFYDDALLVDAEKLLLPFLEKITKRWRHLRLHTPNSLHLKYLNGPLLECMFAAGFTTLRFGYESGSSRYQAQTGGKADERLLREKLALLGTYPFRDTGVYVMGGLPECSPDEMIREMRIVASCGVTVKPVFVTPVPGTPLYHHYVHRFPELASDPHWQNDSFFITRLEGWSTRAVEEIRVCAREMNGALHSSHTD
ncbi:MAG: radical SAM protein [Chitinispirillaceae bacterium]|nr:radical SAM protein [Chitinispirillaceae bacterium]